MSTGADTKANTRELVRSPGGLLQGAQRRVTLEALGESSFSFRTEPVLSQTASAGGKGNSTHDPPVRQEDVAAVHAAHDVVTLEALGESSSSFRTEPVLSQTASAGTEVGAEWCQWALTQKRTLGRRRT